MFNVDMIVIILGYSWNMQNVFSYLIMNNMGDIDIGFVMLIMFCFIVGFFIEIFDGLKLIEDIVLGDCVLIWGGSIDIVLWVGKIYCIVKGCYVLIWFFVNVLGCYDVIDVFF